MSQVRKFVTDADTFKFGFKGVFHRFTNKAFETSDQTLAEYLLTLNQVKEVVEKVEVVVEPTPPIVQSALTEPANTTHANESVTPSDEKLKAQKKAKKTEAEGKK